MLKWITRLGCALAIVGSALLSPLADFLPVGAEPFLRGDLSQAGTTHYYRVVSASGTAINVVPLALVVIGVALVVSVCLWRRWHRSR